MKIVFLGDSLTFGYGVPIRSRWVNLAAAALSIERVNLGVTGDTTGGMLVRLYTEAFQHSPDAIFLMGGFNDLLAENDAVAKSNMMAIVQATLGKRTMPIIGIEPPICLEEVPPHWSNIFDVVDTERRTEEYSKWLRHYAAAFNIPCVDFRREMQATLHRDSGAFAWLDGLHPDVDGHRIMADIFVRRIYGLLPSAV